MFIFKKKLLETNNFIENFKILSSFGFYWWKKLKQFFSLLEKNPKGYINLTNLVFSKYLILWMLLTSEMDITLNFINIWLKKSIQSYKGIRHSLNLPVNGQWTWTNANTQWLLSWNPWKWHFVQKKNWRKTQMSKKLIFNS